VSCFPAFSQTFGEITGEVKDSAGAIIVGAKVTATNTGTSASRETLTTNAGVYSFPSLQPGAYEVRVEQAGFRAAVSRIELQVQ
jgi:protocatechuate 3,4-dioxygenase beta subunit